MDSELELFQQLAQLSRAEVGLQNDLSIIPVAGGRLTKGRRAWPLYSRPFGLRSDDTPTLFGWLRSSPSSLQRVIAGVARVIAKVHDVGYALGTCDARMFAFSASWSSLDAAPDPTPLLVTAPLCAAFGASRQASPPTTELESYSHLGMRIISPSLHSNTEVGAEMDAWSFAAFILDLLARAPHDTTGPILGWDNLWRHAVNRADSYFAMPELARAIGTCMQQPDGDFRMLAALRRMAVTGKLLPPA